MGKYLGIDYGVKRVGLAVADSGAMLARPLATVSPADVAAIIERERPLEAVVLGLPRGLDGQETGQTKLVRTFCDTVLRGELGLEPVLQDEASTSSVAEDRLKQSGRPYAKGDIDAGAAAIILQDYLDSL